MPVSVGINVSEQIGLSLFTSIVACHKHLSVVERQKKTLIIERA